MENRLFKPGAKLGQSFDHRVAKRLTFVGPRLGALFDVVGSVLNKHRYNVFTGWRHARIHDRWNHDVDVGAGGEVAVLGFVVGPFQVIDARRDGDVAPQIVAPFATSEPR